MRFVLLLSVFVISTCGLVYELVSSALASYLLGDSITQFSTIIGVYLFSMGIGSYLSRFVHRRLLELFIHVEFLVGAVGGSSAAILFLLFEHVSSFRLLLYSLISLIGVLVGFEIPILMRILKDHFEFKDLVSKIFTYDCVGALLGSLIFPLVLVPYLGLVRSSFLFGIFNVLVALFALNLFSSEIRWVAYQRTLGVILLIGLGMGFAYSDRLVGIAEGSTYPEPVVYAKSSPYQRIVLTKGRGDLRLYLNGNLQFSSRDEYRYHEALVHVGMQAVGKPKRVLVLGGGDGLALREILKYESVESAVLVDLDPMVTGIFSELDTLKTLNAGALASPRVRVVHEDAFEWLKRDQGQFDFAVIDFPDPSNYSVGKLYTTTFYHYLTRVIRDDGAVVIQSTSPFFARKSFWCVEHTLRDSGFRTIPYHAYVPSFGEWGFILATKNPSFDVRGPIRDDLKFVNRESLSAMLYFPRDMAMTPTEVNRLNNQILVRYFEAEWAEYGH